MKIIAVLDVPDGDRCRESKSVMAFKCVYSEDGEWGTSCGIWGEEIARDQKCQQCKEAEIKE